MVIRTVTHPAFGTPAKFVLGWFFSVNTVANYSIVHVTSHYRVPVQGIQLKKRSSIAIYCEANERVMYIMVDNSGQRSLVDDLMTTIVTEQFVILLQKIFIRLKVKLSCIKTNVLKVTNVANVCFTELLSKCTALECRDFSHRLIART